MTSLADVSGKYPRRVSQRLHYRFGNYGISQGDIESECLVWLYGNVAQVDDWLQASPQKTVSIWWGMWDHARKWCERELQESHGFEPDRSWRYSAHQVEEMLVDVIDRLYTRPNGAIDSYLAGVIEVRQAMDELGLLDYFTVFTPDDNHEDWVRNLRRVAKRLNGDAPRQRRYALSNAQAIALTNDQWAADA